MLIDEYECKSANENENELTIQPKDPPDLALSSLYVAAISLNLRPAFSCSSASRHLESYFVHFLVLTSIKYALSS